MICIGARAQEPAQAAVTVTRPLITQPVDEARLAVLKGNVHPLARAIYDVGTAPATLPMDRMLLVLRRAPEQETALRQLLDSQQDKRSPSYHKWLTPEQFGQHFGPADDDIQKLAAWLQSHGFQVGTTKGRTALEFSGTAGQVKEAFHTSIHKYVVNGEQHWANASDPMIPAALTPAVAGVMTLHNFLSKPQSHIQAERVPAVAVPGRKPDVTFTSNGQVIHALAPQDYAVIYNMAAAYATTTGAGVTIGVVARNDLYNGAQDVQNFHDEIGYGNNTTGGGNPIIYVNGPDPGDSGGGEEGEATLDATWSGAVAPNASIAFVVSGSTNTTDGIDLSELYIIENNLADIMTESFSTCEYFTTDARLAGISALAEQAAAQGITYFVSTGDNGAQGCDDPSNPPASGPVAVNALASTAFNVAVGGTMFNDTANPANYWTADPPPAETAISYIPENVWNESSTTNGLWAGSGGASSGNLGDVQISPFDTTGGVPKPSWQSGTGLNIPQDGVRDLPDVSLTAAGHDPYLLCLEGSCTPNGQGQFFVYFASGTSASAPTFAGIMALIDQAEGGRQGQANYVLYALAAAQASQGIYPSQCNGSSTSALPASTCIFNDVTMGNNVVPGEVGTSYQAGAGYDLTTGLGSVNVGNLVAAWKAAVFNATQTALTLNGATSHITINHGASVNVSATVTASSGHPTGDVALYTTTYPGKVVPPSGGFGSQVFSLVGGVASGTTTQLPGGSYAVTAHYPGDGTFAASDSSQVLVTVQTEPSTTTLSLEASDLSGHAVSSPFPFGSLVFVRADVTGNSGHGIPTGAVTFTDTFGSLPTLNPQIVPPVVVVNNPTLNSQGNTSIGDGIISFDAGNHTISASYSGDNSFNVSSSTAPVSFTVSPGFAGVSQPTDVTIASPGGSGTSTVAFITSTGFSTAISLACSGLPAEATCTSSPVTGAGPITPVTATINVSTTAPQTANLQRERRYYYAVVLVGGLPLAGIFVVAAPRRRGWSVLLGLMMLASLIMIPACGGGGGGSHHQDQGTPAGTSTVTVTATAGSLTQSGTFTLVVK